MMAIDSISGHELEGFDPILVSKYFIFVLPYYASIRYLQPVSWLLNTPT
jgi:hypothetical protein